MIIESGSIEETTKRLGVLYQKHHSWLIACAYNQSKDKRVSEDLVQELYLYLGTKRNPKLFYNDSFNLLYCHNFIRSRYINYIKRENKMVSFGSSDVNYVEEADKPYNIMQDKQLHQTYDMIKQELDRLSKTKMWSSSKLYELYAFSELTMEELSKEIGLSKSTVFLNIKKIKEHLKEVINNPFNEEKNR